jgi:hypothetical protein
MRINTNDYYESNSDGSFKKKDTFLQVLKSVHELPEEMQDAIRANAALLSQSFEIQTNDILREKHDNMEPGDLSAVLTPFVMELSFLKIQLAAVTSELDKLRNGDSN